VVLFYFECMYVQLYNTMFVVVVYVM